jgi:methionyl aminopeptidase
MEENEIYAIETFASTGTGNITNYTNTTHYKQNKFDKNSLKSMKHMICKEYIINRNGLPFNPKWFSDIKNDDIKNDDINKEINKLVKNQILEQYPPLVDINTNALTSQMEHTIYIKESGIINLSHSDDY